MLTNRSSFSSQKKDDTPVNGRCDQGSTLVLFSPQVSDRRYTGPKKQSVVCASELAGPFKAYRNAA